MERPDGGSSADLSVRELIRRVRDGETERFAEIVRRYQHEVLRVAQAMLFDRSEVEEVVQTVFVRAFTRLETYDPQYEFAPWIRTVTRNTVREELRRNARYARRLATYREMVEAAWQDNRAAEERHGRLYEALEACLDRLPERARTVIDLRYRRGMAYDRIAETMETTPGAMRNLLCRVRNTLRRCVRQEISQP